ncbi:MAG: hypothetical protein M0Z49_00495 [Chloroflexi bacterium]|nr:hypothetical protein [Chloroflexota bacterium]
MTLLALGTVQGTVAGRGYRDLAKMAANRQVALDIKAPPRLCRWRRFS